MFSLIYYACLSVFENVIKNFIYSKKERKILKERNNIMKERKKERNYERKKLERK